MDACAREALIIHLSQTRTVYTLICGTNNTRRIELTHIEIMSMVHQLQGCNVRELELAWKRGVEDSGLSVTLRSRRLFQT